MKMTFFKKATGSPVGDAAAGDVLTGKTFQSAAAGPAATGTMPEIGKHDVTPGTSPQSIPEGYHDGTGEVDSLGGDAPASAVLEDYEFSSDVAGREVQGTMENIGQVVITPGTTDQAIAAGYHDGTGYVEGDPNLDAGNIKEDVEIFGVVGTLTPASPPVGTADLDDVIKGKTFESAVAGAGAVGTLELTGDAGAGDVISGKKFYNTNPKTQVTGSLTLTGDAAAGDVLTGKTFYNTNPKSKQTGTMVNRGAHNITPGKTAITIPAGYHNGSGQVASLGGNATAGDVLSGKTFSSNTAGRAVSGTLVIPQNDILYSKGFICTAAGDWVIGFDVVDGGVLTKYSNYMLLTTTYNTIITPGNTIDLTNYNLLIAYVTFTCVGQNSKFTLAIGPDTVHPGTFVAQQAYSGQSLTNQLITLDISSITGFKNVALHAQADSPSTPSSLTVYHVILM